MTGNFFHGRQYGQHQDLLRDFIGPIIGNNRNNRLTEYKGNSVTYDLDGNMLSNGTLSCAYDSGNRLISAGGHTYTYNAENVRIRNLCADADTTYVYNTNCKLSQLLCKTTNGITTKYVYGLGLIGEEKENCFKTYHFDFRGSTVAITDANGTITDTFAYDTYGKLVSRTGTSFVIFGYNGRDGVVTDKNGLICMRARYYAPELRRFINADVVAGSLDNSITLNRFAYANGNPISFVDPFGLSAERGSGRSGSFGTDHEDNLLTRIVFMVEYLWLMVTSPLKATTIRIGGGIGVGASASGSVSGVNIGVDAKASIVDSFVIEDGKFDIRTTTSYGGEITIADVVTFGEIEGVEHSIFEEQCTCDLWKDPFFDRQFCPASEPIKDTESLTIGVSVGGFVGIGVEASIGIDLGAWNRYLNEIHQFTLEYGK